MKKVCVILNGEVKNDSRVIKTINSISREHLVDLFYINGCTTDCKIFNENVRLFSCCKEDNICTKIIKHSLFYNEYLFFIKKALSTGVNYDFVWANDLPCLKPAIKIKQNIGAKVIYDSHEIYVETLNQFFPQTLFGIKRILIKYIIRFMKYSGYLAEKKLLKETDSFITVGNELKRYFELNYNFIGIKVMMNCPFSNGVINKIQLKKMLGIDENDTLFIYQGDLNSGRGLKLLVESFKLVKDGIFLLILGWGMLKKELIDDVNSARLERKIFFLEKVDVDKLASYTDGADFGVNLLEDLNLSKRYAMPNKLFEYIHAEIPVISSNSPESISVYKKYNIGKLVNNNPVEIAEAINMISNEDVEIYKLNCKEAKKVYNWENQEKVLKDILN
jgi:glycosyltransferase involved in cell wall biosynthesis